MSLIFFKLILFGFLVLPRILGDQTNIKNEKTNIFPVHKFKVLFLEANSTFYYKPSKNGVFEKHLNTYCYSGEPKTLGRLLETIEFKLEIESDDYIQYEGNNPAEVEEHYSEHRSIFNLNLFSPKRSRLLLSPFMQQCIGIETVLSYNVTMHRENIDLFRSVQLLSGIIIFLFAGIFSTNSLFYYITGIFLGIFSSFLLLIWLSGKLMPKRTMMYSAVIGGWTVGFYIIRMLWDNIKLIMMTYRNYVYWYIVITGIISFFFCYRFGPPRNRRSKNIIKWLLQLMSSALIYFSSNFKEASLAIVLMTVILYYFPRVLKKIMSLRTRAFKYFSNQNKYFDNSSRVKELRDDYQLWRANNPQYSNWTVKHKLCPLPTINTKQRINPTDQSDVKCRTSNFSSEKQHIDECHSDSDVKLDKQDLIKNLYPLPDGSFILSEKPPIILTPRRMPPVYHGSMSELLFDAQDNVDYTPKKHYHQKPLTLQSRILNAAASTSDLSLIGHLRTTLSQSQLHRSHSVQGVPSRWNRMVDSARKHHYSNPKIRIKNPTSDDES